MESEKSSREKGIYKVTIVGSIVNFLLLVFKFFAGIAGHSAAMLADAVHSLSDFITDIVVIVFVRIAGKPEDKGHDYGHGKYETLATAIIGLLLLCVGFGIFWNGASSIYTFLRGGQLESPGVVALVAALVSIVSKEILYRDGHRYRRCHPVGRSLAGARSGCCGGSQFLYHEGVCTVADSVCGRTA